VLDNDQHTCNGESMDRRRVRMIVMVASSSGPLGSSLNVVFGIVNREFHSSARRGPYVSDIGDQLQLQTPRSGYFP